MSQLFYDQQKTFTTLFSLNISFFKKLVIFSCAEFSLLLRLFSSCGEQGLLSSCSAQISHRRVFSRCGAHAHGPWASTAAAPALNSCGPWALEHKLSSCSSRAQLLLGMWIFLDQGLKPCLLRWQLDS